MYCNLESLLIKAAYQQDYTVGFQKVNDFYADDLTASSLSAQLAAFASHFRNTSNAVTLNDCLKYLQSLSDGAQSYFSEVCQVAKLMLVMPATNAFSRCCFSAMRRIKSHLHNTTG